jgi:hypothetical protein
MRKNNIKYFDPAEAGLIKLKQVLRRHNIAIVKVDNLQPLNETDVIVGLSVQVFDSLSLAKKLR